MASGTARWGLAPIKPARYSASKLKQTVRTDAWDLEATTPRWIIKFIEDMFLGIIEVVRGQIAEGSVL